MLAEVAGVVRRTRRDPIPARLAVAALRALPYIRFVPMDDPLAQGAAEIAGDYALRGADALYIAVARQHGCTFVSLDREARERSAPIVTVRTPAEALAELAPAE